MSYNHQTLHTQPPEFRPHLQCCPNPCQQESRRPHQEAPALQFYRSCSAKESCPYKEWPYIFQCYFYKLAAGYRPLSETTNILADLGLKCLSVPKIHRETGLLLDRFWQSNPCCLPEFENNRRPVHQLHRFQGNRRHLAVLRGGHLLQLQFFAVHQWKVHIVGSIVEDRGGVHHATF